MIHTDVLILGAGPAGFQAAKAAGRFKGTVQLSGAEAYLPYWRPRLSEIIFTGAQEKSICISNEEWFQANSIQCRVSRRAVSIDPSQKTVRWEDGDSTDYRSLILACGSAPAIPSFPTAEKIYTLRSYPDAIEIRKKSIHCKKAFIIGGGVLGLETAFALKKLDCQVAVSVHSYLLSHQLDQEGGLFLKKLLEKEGIVICCGDPVDFQEESTDACVIAATGVRPSLELAESCGIRVNRGIIVDEKMRTNISDIYACGDVAEYGGAVPGLIEVAVKQGETAGINAAGGEALYRPVFPSSFMKLGKLSVLSIGSMKPLKNSQIYRRINEKGYAATIVTEGKITGSAWIGDITPGIKFKKWIESGKEIGSIDSFEELETKIS